MFQVLALVVPLFAIILLGYLCGRVQRLPVTGLAWLNVFIVYLALPALFFQLLSQTPLHEFANGGFLLRTTLGTLLIFVLCFAIAKLVRRAALPESAIQGFAGAYGNVGYLGPPLAIAAFGPAAGVPVALIFCLDNALHFTLAPLLMAIGNERRQSFVALMLHILRQIVSHPFILATLAGIGAAAFELNPPAPLRQLLDSLAAAAAPCALFAMGVTAALKPLRRIPLDLLWLVPIKLIVHPVLVYLLLSPLPGIDPLWVRVAVLMAALPSATNVFVLAQQYGVWEERASSAVIISTLAAMLTLTTYLYLVGAGLSAE